MLGRSSFAKCCVTTVCFH